MVRLITVANPRIAQAFVDFMATQGVQLAIRHSNEGVEIWLHDEKQREQAERELERFLSEPLNRRYLAASWKTGNTQTHLPYRNTSYLKLICSQAGPVTLNVMAICIIVYVLSLVLGINRVMSWLSWPQNSQQYWQLWRWVSHAFLHFSLLHIIFNLFWWWYLGAQVEKRLGGERLFVIAVVSAFFSGWAQSLFSGVLFGGLSGVVYALIGYVWLTGLRAPDRTLMLPNSLMIFSLLWLVAGYFGVFGITMANAAHIAGLIIGLLMAFWDTRKRSQ